MKGTKPVHLTLGRTSPRLEILALIVAVLPAPRIEPVCLEDDRQEQHNNVQSGDQALSRRSPLLMSCLGPFDG